MAVAGGDEGGEGAAVLPVGDDSWRIRLAWRSPRKALPIFAIRSDGNNNGEIELVDTRVGDDRR